MMNEELRDIPVYELNGSFHEMGRQFGEACRDQINELYEVRIANALEHASERGRRIQEVKAIYLAEKCLKHCQQYFPEGYDEFIGICEGANISPARLYVCQGLTDFRDYLSWGDLPDGYGCTSLIVPKEKSEEKSILLAQTWDLQTSNMPYVCMVKRFPKNAPKTVYMTTTGGLALIGMNEHGLSIGTNNIKCTDSRLGVHYLFIIHNFLRQSSINEGLACIQSATRSGAHYYFISDGYDYAGVECSATKHSFIDKTPYIYHTNHCVTPDIKELEAEYSGDSSEFRYKEVSKLLHKHSKHKKTNIIKILSNKNGGSLAINRVNFNKISSNGSVIMDPINRKISACRMQADVGNWKEFSV